MRTRRSLWMAPLVALLLAAPLEARAFDLFRSDGATAADIHAALKAKTLTCRVLVQMPTIRATSCCWAEVVPATHSLFLHLPRYSVAVTVASNSPDLMSSSWPSW